MARPSQIATINLRNIDSEALDHGCINDKFNEVLTPKHQNILPLTANHQKLFKK